MKIIALAEVAWLLILEKCKHATSHLILHAIYAVALIATSNYCMLMKVAELHSDMRCNPATHYQPNYS